MEIYLDNHSTTFVDPRVKASMIPFLEGNFGNPSSGLHKKGKEASDQIRLSRKYVADLIGADSKNIVFTSGATEANNLALIGIKRGSKSQRFKLLCSNIEHKSILSVLEYLSRENAVIDLVEVNSEGRLNQKNLKNKVDENTLIVSIQSVSNEIGTIQDIAKISKIVHKAGSLLHVDAAQAPGKIPINVDDWGADLISLSAHKMYGPKGVGALYIRGGPFALPIEPIIFGGGQENGLRSGTENVPGIIGMGMAAKLALEQTRVDIRRTQAMRDRFESIIMKALDVKINGDVDNRISGNCSVTFNDRINAEALVSRMPNIMISTGSACNSGAPEPSHVLERIGLSRDLAYSTIRVCFGRFNSEDEVDIAAKQIITTVQEMVKDNNL